MSTFQQFLAIAFGELEISNLTFGILIGLSAFVFVAVGLSSYKLIQSLTNEEEV